MAFNAYRWDPRQPKPSCVKKIDTEVDKIHYVGRSEIKSKSVHFLVSDNIIPAEPPQYVFDESFLNNMELNKEIDIPGKSKERLEATVRRYLGKTINYIIPQGLINGKYVYYGKQQNGHMDKTITQEWIDSNFQDQFPNDYEDIMKPENIGKRFEVVSGAIGDHGTMDVSESDEEEDVGNKIPSRYISTKSVNYQFDNKNSCAFGNMANACFLLNDNKAAQFFYRNREGDMNKLREAHTKIHQ